MRKSYRQFGNKGAKNASQQKRLKEQQSNIPQNLRSIKQKKFSTTFIDITKQ